MHRPEGGGYRHVAIAVISRVITASIVISLPIPLYYYDYVMFIAKVIMFTIAVTVMVSMTIIVIITAVVPKGEDTG